MEGETAFWHRRFEHQLSWMGNTRDFIYRKLHFIDAGAILELGCGTGALLSEIGTRFMKPRQDAGKDAVLAGIEIDPSRAANARSTLEKHGIKCDVRTGNAGTLPFKDGEFTIVACNYFLMWLDDDARACVMKEASRVLKKGGYLVIFAEPDYEGIIDHPNNGWKQAMLRSLEQAGASTSSGRFLHQDLQGFENVHVECCSQPWSLGALLEHFDDEWTFYERALACAFDTKDGLVQLKRKDLESIKQGTKFTFVPVFFGYGRKP